MEGAGCCACVAVCRSPEASLLFLILQLAAGFCFCWPKVLEEVSDASYYALVLALCLPVRIGPLALLEETLARTGGRESSRESSRDSGSGH